MDPTPTATPTPTRLAHDSLGPIAMPAGALWGAQTARSLQFFAIGRQQPGQGMPLAMLGPLPA